MTDDRKRLSLTRRGLFRVLPTLGVFGLVLPALAGECRADGGDRASIGVPGVRGGVVATSEPIPAEIGAEVLRRGGNAIDAAVAIHFALNVVEPQSSGIGGGGFMMIHLAKKRQTFVLDSRERAPAAADPGMFLQASDPTSPFAFSIRSTSGIGVGVPGTVLGLATALDRWGTISLAEALAPSIDLAENGFRVSTRLAESVLSGRLDSEPGNPAYDEARNVFRPGGMPLAAGDLLVQPDLARTFKIIAAEGPDGFYRGPLAQAIVDTQLNTRSVADPADQARLAGRMTLQDLIDYRVAIREPVVGDYRGLKIVSMPPPSSGGLTVIQMLKMLERFPIGDRDRGYGFGSTRTLNVMVEAMRLAFADRAVWMGDDDFVDVPSRGLLNDRYVALRSALIDPDARQAVVEADDPRPFDNAALEINGPHRRLAALNGQEEGGINTTHFSVIDRHGNVVTYTTTIESAWGTGLMVPGYGFLLNNELTDFNSTPAFNPDPANFNPGANDAAPNKRPRSSMAPTMVFDGRRFLAAYGSPGGSTIINSVLNMSLNLIDHRRPVQEAIDLPRISQTSANGTVSREAGFSDAAINGLAALGHTVRDPGDIGSVQAVVVDPRGKLQYGGADSRRIGRVISVRRNEIAGHRGDDDDDDDDDD